MDANRGSKRVQPKQELTKAKATLKAARSEDGAARPRHGACGLFGHAVFRRGDQRDAGVVQWLVRRSKGSSVGGTLECLTSHGEMRCPR